MGRQSARIARGSIDVPPVPTFIDASSTAQSSWRSAARGSTTKEALLNSGMLQMQHTPRTRGSRLSVRSSIGMEQSHFHWLRYENHDMVDEADVEVMPATDLGAVKNRVETMGYSGFCLFDDMAHIKKVSKQLHISDLDKVEPGRNAVFFILYIDLGNQYNTQSHQPEGLRERLALTRQLTGDQRTACLEHLKLLDKQMSDRIESLSHSSISECDDASSAGEEAPQGNPTDKHWEAVMVPRRGMERRDSTQSHKETRIAAQNFLKDFHATPVDIEAAGQSSDIQTSDHSQAVGHRVEGDRRMVRRKPRRRSFHLDLFSPPTGCKGVKPVSGSPPMALQRDLCSDSQDVNHAVKSAQELLDDEIGRQGMDAHSVAGQFSPPVRGLDSLLRTSLRFVLQPTTPPSGKRLREEGRFLKRCPVMHEETW